MLFSTGLFFEIGVALIIITLFLLYIILRDRNIRILKMRNDSLTCEELEDHAKKTAVEHSVTRRLNHSRWPVPRMNDNYSLISSVYKNLNEDVQKKRAMAPAAEWLLDNFYIIEEQVKNIRHSMNRNDYSRLPVLKCGALKGYARIFAVALDIITHTDGQVDEDIILNYLKAYQTHGYLYDREIWAIPAFIRLALIEEIRQTCEKVRDAQLQWNKVDEIFDGITSDENDNADSIIKLFKSGIKSTDSINQSFVEHLFFRLRRAGQGYAHVLKYIDEYLEKSGTTMESITQKEHNAQAVNTVSIGNCITSLKLVSTLDWINILEAASHVEQILRQDPDGTYPRMDLQSRNYYRSRIEKLANGYHVSEFHIAAGVVELARKAHDSLEKINQLDSGDAKSCHVGYYLIDEGKSMLEDRIKYKTKPVRRADSFLKRYPGIFYFGFIVIISAILDISAIYFTFHVTHRYLISVLGAVAALVPSSEIALSLVNWISCKIYKPFFFPRLELKKGVPSELSSIVVIPALISDEKRLNGLIENLESHYLSNREEHLYFAIIGDFKDFSEPHSKDDEGIISTALRGIEELNKKYSGDGREKFFFFHRERRLNKLNNKWMGWERKRGAILEFNGYMLGEGKDSFKYVSSNLLPASDIKYVITLDADTILPMGMAKKMIGTMAHPLNKPVMDTEKKVIVKGYGLIQPRIAFDIESSNKSLFSSIFTGQGGIDPYAGAVSDVYQDLFGEGIFTGKGIYDVRVFQTILKEAIPENTILSHDLLEGSYIRTALVTDLELVDAYPSKYSSFISRLYRWVRGDWQLLQWLKPKIRNGKDEIVKNPLSGLSRWKILDNIRRSLVTPFLFIMIIAGFSIFSAACPFWICFAVAVLITPLITSSIDFIISGRVGASRIKRHMHIISGVKAVFFQFLLAFIFLPYQACMMFKAIIITTVRVFITKRNMLEWITAADAEKGQKNSAGSYWRRMYIALISGAIVIILAIAYSPGYSVFGALFLILWGISPLVAFWISREREECIPVLPEKDINELRKIARKTWRYFEEFSNFRNHFLIPDNFQEDPPRGVAYRSSPTNIGLGLLAVLSARDLGYVCTSEMIDLAMNTVSTMERLEKWNGHLYNWYDIRTLRPLRPGYISTVDSGNLVCYLITMSQGIREYLDAPLIDKKLIYGLKDILYIIGKNSDEMIPAALKDLHFRKNIDLGLWSSVLNDLSNVFLPMNIKKYSWEAKASNMIKLFKNEIMDFAPWINMIDKMPQNLMKEEIYDQREEIVNLLKCNISLSDMAQHYQRVSELSDQLAERLKNNGNTYGQECHDWIRELKNNVLKAVENSNRLVKKCETLVERIEALSSAIRFQPLYVERKQLFSIGYNIEENRLTNSFYDLFASEARQTSYIAIARGEVEPRHWGKLGRALTSVDGYKGLVSWTGTMFEYLMPLLLMKSYRNTLLDETYSFVIRSQIKYGKQRGMPWGASESGFNSLDINLDYQYKAIGVPWLGLKRGLVQDAVATPYATFLALLVDPLEAYENIKFLKSEGLEGAYGYYEAVDYTQERLPFGEKHAIVKSYMAHHQGMSLLSINNYLNSNVMQRRFHNDPVIRSARLLLQEKVPLNVIYTKETKEKVIPYKEAIYKEKGSFRKFHAPDPVLPKTHILSNGNYSVMLTDKGTGYSRNKIAAVSRWREDSTLDHYGMFFYLRDVENNSVWSSSYAPLNKMPEKYEVTFMADKARFKRRDGDIETVTEVTVASGDNGEIRRITLKNFGKQAHTIDITSYFEVVLAPHAADIAHPAFSNLFIRTEFNVEKKCLIANRRPRTEEDKNPWIAHKVISEVDTIGDIQYETDRMQFIGRGHNVSDPSIIERGKPLSNTAGAVLDPIMSLKARVVVEAGKTVKISYVTVVSENEDTLIDMIDRYSISEAVEGAFKLALIRSQVEARYMNRKVSDIELYQEMISGIVFMSPSRRLYNDIISKNRKGQSSLWPYGISGDLPIVLVVLKKTDETDILLEVLKAHEYWRIKGLNVDLVVLSDEENSYTNPLYALLSDIVLSVYTHDVINKPGGVFILDRNNMPEEDASLLYAAARIVLKGEAGLISDQMRTKNKGHYPKKKDFQKAVQDYVLSAMPEYKLEFFNGIGGFKDEGNEYVIRLEKGQNTPAPWSNVISNPKFGFLTTESGSGYTWSKNSRENKLTQWSNDPVSELTGEAVYITDNETGESWTITPLPVREDEPYVTRHGFGYTIFEHNSQGIEQSMTQFVPIDDTVKISIINLKNVSGSARDINLTYYIRPVLGVTDQFTAMHVKTSIGDSGALIVENPYNEEFPGQICFVDAPGVDKSITGDRKEFLGFGGLRSPDALRREKLSGAVGVGFDPCAVLQVNLSLSEKENRKVVLLFGSADNKGEVKLISERYGDAPKAEEALDLVVKSWENRLGGIKINTPDVSMNIMMNGWLLYQVISCRIWARSAFYQSGGAFGFRDQLQDCIPCMQIIPELASQQILYHARHQFKEGDVQHWWHEPSGKGTRTRFSDDLLWLPYVVSEYVRITGDITILDLEEPYIEDEVLKEFEDEKYSVPHVSEETGSVYDHCLRVIEKSLKFGVHGLPMMGSGDWNDGMNTVGNLGCGESVWLGWFMCSVLEKFSGICRAKGNESTARRYSKIRDEIREALDENAWDGNWYRRAYFDSGIPLGSVQNSECKIDSIAQTWAVISGAGNKQKVLRAMGSLEDYLVQREEGLIKLLTPPFDQGDLEPGYIKGYVPGVRENGGQYTHAAAWVIIAFAELGEGDKAWEFFEMVNPINHTRTFIDYSRYKVEPYVMAADVYAVHPHTGRGGWTWYTGSAGWIYRAGLEYILGFRKNGDSIMMNPCIPKKWREYELTYKFEDTDYTIRVKNPDGVSMGVTNLYVDGNIYKGNVFKLVNDKSKHEIEVVMGNPSAANPSVTS